MSNRKQTITSQQVADYVGVSRTTVSLVLNNVGSASISETTRQRVLQAARELGYVPDEAARTLARGHSRNLGVFIYQASEQVFFDPYVPSILTGISQVARAHGYRILVENVESIEAGEVIVQMLRSKEIAGAITEGWFLPHPLLKDLSQQYPMVLLTDAPVEGFFCICTDLLIGVRQLLLHLVALGHRRIGCLPYTTAEVSTSVAQRIDVYRQISAQHNLDTDPALIAWGDYDIETGYRAMQTLLALPAPPTAVYAMNDSMAFGAMRAIQDAGLHVPDDIALVGYDDQRLAAWTTPALTTVHVPWVEQGRLASETLIQWVQGVPPASPAVSLDTRLIIRESCGAQRRV